MKILLTAINAKYIHSNLAVYSLAAYAGEYLHKGEKEKCNIEIAEYTINHKVEAIYGDIYKKKPDVIGISCYIWNWEYVREIIRELSKILPDTKIYLGGPEVSFSAGEILKEYPFLAGIMEGEGEETFLELCRFYTVNNREKKPRGIAGLRTIEDEGKNILWRKPVVMDSIPFIYKNMENFSHRIVYYESSRGCPFRCSYCLSSIDKELRFRSIEKVKKELQFFLDEKVPQVKFIDRTFNVRRDHALSIWNYILENDNGITNFHFEISADLLTKEELSLMERMRPGLIQLEIGVQSTNTNTLKEIERVTDLKKLEENVARVNSFKNIHQHLDLIAGLPYEGFDSFQNSFNQVYQMEPQQLQLGFLKVLKGAKMWYNAEAYGLNYTFQAPYEVLFTRWLSFEEILKLKRIEEMVEIYYNSSQFIYTMAMLVKEFANPFLLYQQLGEFYENKGYDLMSPSRSYRYHILLDFCIQKASEKEEMYKELLIFDLYLREKNKTRPQFAEWTEERKEISYHIYKKEEEERKLLPDYKEYNSKQMEKMTHLELFSHSVWEKGECKKLNAPCPVLFDYKRRNPLTAEANVIVIQEE